MCKRIITLKALNDNYIHMVCHGESVVAIDPGEALPVEDFLQKNGFRLVAILLTHHHKDHTGGVPLLVRRTGAPVLASSMRSYPKCDRLVQDGEPISVGSVFFHVLAVPGHTQDSVCYLLPGNDQSNPALFTGDTLFTGGCGRLLEGTAEQMYSSLNRIKRLEPETELYPGHDYTADNYRFALSQLPGDGFIEEQLSLAGKEFKPTNLELEMKTNIFLMTEDSRLKNPSLPEEEGLAVFRRLRNLKNRF